MIVISSRTFVCSSTDWRLQTAGCQLPIIDNKSWELFKVHITTQAGFVRLLPPSSHLDNVDPLHTSCREREGSNSGGDIVVSTDSSRSWVNIITVTRVKRKFFYVDPTKIPSPLDSSFIPISSPVSIHLSSSSSSLQVVCSTL